MPTSDVTAWGDAVQRELGLEAFHVWPERDDLRLGLIRVPRGARGKGIGTAAMERLVAYADEVGKRIVLSPNTRDAILGTTSRARLVKFYKRFGFHENKGRKMDYGVSHEMIRDPAPRCAKCGRPIGGAPVTFKTAAGLVHYHAAHAPEKPPLARSRRPARA